MEAQRLPVRELFDGVCLLFAGALLLTPGFLTDSVGNDFGRTAEYVMTGEDLCSVGIVPTQSDLCLVATLGLDHIERNGHHYHPGLSYLPSEQQSAALAAHGDLYARQHGIIAPLLANGRFQIGSLQCEGFGFAVEPDMNSMEIQ